MQRLSLGSIAKKVHIHFSIKVLFSYNLNITKWSRSQTKYKLTLLYYQRCRKSLRLKFQHCRSPFQSRIILTFITWTTSCFTWPNSCWSLLRSSSLVFSMAFICSSISAFIFLRASSVFWAVLKAFSSSSKATMKTAENKYLKKYYHWAKVFYIQFMGTKSSSSRRG